MGVRMAISIMSLVHPSTIRHPRELYCSCYFRSNGFFVIVFNKTPALNELSSNEGDSEFCL